MPFGPVHSLLTRCAIEGLTAAHQDVLSSEFELLCSEYCLYPDTYYGDPETTERFLCFIDEIPFHYIPHEPVEYNNWKMERVDGVSRLVPLPLSENIHHRHTREGFLFYFRNISESLAAERITDAAKFIGALCHVLQDNTVSFHALEGVDGVDVFVLDRLVRPPADRPYMTSSMLIQGMDTSDPGKVECSPRLLGSSPEEAAFHGYSRFCEVVASNRYHLLPLVMANYVGNPAEERECWLRIYRDTIRLVVDFLHTGFALATRSFTPDELASLREVPLENVRAARRPRLLSPPYRFTPFVSGVSLDANRNSVPLALEWNGERCEYQRGLGMGAHVWFAFDYELPAGVFSKIVGAIGLHPDFGREGDVRMRWLRDGKPVWETELTKESMAASFEIDVSEGGWWKLEGNARTERPLSEANHLVLAEPRLIRASPSSN